jgi:hypothetical protein
MAVRKDVEVRRGMHSSGELNATACRREVDSSSTVTSSRSGQMRLAAPSQFVGPRVGDSRQVSRGPWLALLLLRALISSRSLVALRC